MKKPKEMTAITFKQSKGLIPSNSDLSIALNYIKELEELNEQLAHQQRADGETIKKLSEVKSGRLKEIRIREGSPSRSVKRTTKDSTMEGTQ